MKKQLLFSMTLLSWITSSLFVFADSSSQDIQQLDFREALEGVQFNPKTADGNGASHSGNGMLDVVEMKLVEAVLKDNSIDLSQFGGVSHAMVLKAYRQAATSAKMDLAGLQNRFPSVVELVIGYVLIGTQDSYSAINHMATSFGAPLKSDYSESALMGKYFGVNGDADGDGWSNLSEYQTFIGSGVDVYVAAALNPNKMPDSDEDVTPMNNHNNKMNVGIILYPQFEVLDVYGPVEMWGYVQEFNLITIAENEGPVMSTQGVASVAQYSFENAPPLDIIMVPGGTGTLMELNNPVLLKFLQEQGQQVDIATSVCTGSALLAAAGVLDGHKATSNKRFFSLATDQSDAVDWIVKARWVDDGKVVTSSGVSAGTDMALGLIARLFGKQRAETIASAVEYEWHQDPNVDPFAQFVQTP